MARTPLHLANLCLVYEAKHHLPDPPIRVYEYILNLRLERWDQDRRVHRLSQYGAHFGPPQKQRFLAALSFQLATAGVKARFYSNQLTYAYASVASNFNLPLSEANAVTSEIESHTGLIVRVEDDLFEFYHSSLFEYLVLADQISRSQLDTHAVQDLLRMAEPAAIACGLAANPDRFFMHLAYRVRLAERHHYRQALAYRDFWNRLLSRLNAERILIPCTRWAGLGAVFIAGLCGNGEASERLSFDQIGPVRAELCRLAELWKMRSAVKEGINLFEFKEIQGDRVMLCSRATDGRTKFLFAQTLYLLSRSFYNWAKTAAVALEWKPPLASV